MLAVQREGLLAPGVTRDRIYVDHGLTGCNRERPGLREALAACHDGDTIVVTELDRLGRSLPDARAIADELTARRVRLNLGGSMVSWVRMGRVVAWSAIARRVVSIIAVTVSVVLLVSSLRSAGFGSLVYTVSA